ncbi:hypothetical protein [Clostridium sp. CF012]|uniref:hypothetical protein n=1 Tax=Clostridium sp. CF012 TaxID=2843319 RepID=UPI001C0C9883|nr:hypothetical protein [Clostridium sp. CF012]MBU3142660.1 hypothetical protein [Clostridium sp. CF012]
MTISNEKKFQLKLDKTSKTLFVEVSGSFGPTDANVFLQEYTEILKSINPKEYKLLFDGKELKVSGKDAKSGIDMTEMLKGCVQQYKKDDFKEVIIDCGTNIVMKMQSARIAKEVGLLNFKAI